MPASVAVPGGKREAARIFDTPVGESDHGLPMSDDPPASASAPVAPLEYSYPGKRGRPGLITAIGVLSIVVASLSGVSSLWGTFSGFSYYMMSQMPPAGFAAPAPPATAPVGSATTAPAAAGAVSMSIISTSGGATTMTTTTTTAGGAAAAPVMMGNPFGNISPLAAILNILTNALSLGLAIYLLVIGILTLRDSPRGGTLHWWYALLKIPLVIATTAVTLWLWWGIMRSMNVATPGAGAPPMEMMGVMGVMSLMTIIPACLALAYPIGLILVLRSKSVRDYYSAVRE